MIQYFKKNEFECTNCRYFCIKGQLISKAIYGVLDSPKKRTKKIEPEVS